MKSNVSALLVSLAMAGSLVAAQESQDPTAPRPSPAVPTVPAPSVPAPRVGPELTVVGCLIQGSGPTVFILENARMSADAADPATPTSREIGKSYVVMALSPADVNLRSHLNHQVRITGLGAESAAPAPNPGQKVAEKDLPKLSAKSVDKVADVCPAVSPA